MYKKRLFIFLILVFVFLNGFSQNGKLSEAKESLKTTTSSSSTGNSKASSKSSSNNDDDDSFFGSFFAEIFIKLFAYSAYGIAVESVNMLMDHALDPEVVETIESLVKQNEHILGCHDIRTRQSGNIQFIQVHLDFDALQPLYIVHEQGEWLTEQLLFRYPRADILVHHDPVSTCE